VVEGVSHVKVAAGIGRRRIDGEDWMGFVVPVEAVDAHLLPQALPFFLDFEDVALFGQWFHLLVLVKR